MRAATFNSVGYMGESLASGGTPVDFPASNAYHAFISSWIPSQLVVLPRCRTLRLDNNVLSGLPDGLLTLTALTHLSLRHNNFSNLPYRFGDLHRLQKLDLGQNMLKTLPPTMVTN